MSTVKIFSGTTSYYLSEKIADHYGRPLGKIQIDKFSDGEICPIYNESVRGCEVFIVQSTFAPTDNLMEVLLMIDAAKRASAKHITVVLPYFGYARQDRKDRPRVPIAAKMIVNLIQAAGANRVITMDLHADQIQGFFDIPVDHLDGSAIFVPYVNSLGLKSLLFASPDVGGTKRTRKFAKRFEASMVIIDKQRKRANVIESMQIIGDVKGHDVVLIDDIVDTAGTLCRAAQAIMDEGANSVRAIATHPILSGNALSIIENSALTELVVTDTIPLKVKLDKIKVLTVAGLFSKAIRKIHENDSISALFI